MSIAFAATPNTHWAFDIMKVKTNEGSVELFDTCFNEILAIHFTKETFTSKEIVKYFKHFCLSHIKCISYKQIRKEKSVK